MNNTATFISDVHLSNHRQHILQAFHDFLPRITSASLYILGDLFDYWAGDDMAEAWHIAVFESLQALVRAGTAVFIMHGNRDFLLSQNFCQQYGISLLQDPTLLVFEQKRILLSHGDSLCTDDVTYQSFRRQVRDPSWQKNFLSQTKSERLQQIAYARIQSDVEKSQKEMYIMDINPTALTNLLKEYNYPELFIHGHTHRPQKHIVHIDGYQLVRWVLGDWYEQGSYLLLDTDGCRSVTL